MKIFLDLDGTIFDVKRKCYRLYVNILSHGGFDVIDLPTYWKLKTNKIPEEQIASKTTSERFAKYYVEKRISLFETIDYLMLDTVFDKVYTTLHEWSVNNDLYLVTLRKDGATLSSQLFFFNLYKYFNKVIYNTYGSVSRKEEIIKHEVFDRNDCVIIGDTEADVEAGKFLGIKTAAVTSGLRGRCLLEKAHPDILVKNICDPKLLSWIEGDK